MLTVFHQNVSEEKSRLKVKKCLGLKEVKKNQRVLIY